MPGIWAPSVLICSVVLIPNLCENESSGEIHRGVEAMRPKTFCDGLERRDFLRLGAAGVFGMGLTLPALLEGQARAAAKGKTAKDVSLIFLFLHGGLSTMDSWDLKPDAPSEFRGDFSPISTNVPGIQIGEHLPRAARQMDKF